MNISIRMFGDFEVSKEEKLIFTKTHQQKFNKNQVIFVIFNFFNLDFQIF